METADKIRELRERTGMTRKDFAMHIGIPLRTVEDWEAGRRRPPEYIPRLISYQLRYEELMKKMEEETNEIVIFETEDSQISLSVPVENEMVWLSANQMAALFERDEKTIRKHINNVFSEEEVNQNNNTQKMRVDGVKQLVPFYTLDVIISVGYRVKSKRGVEFRRWANSVLKQYILKGYAVNDNRIKQLGEVIRIMKRTEDEIW